jgi:hypothetical protein
MPTPTKKTEARREARDKKKLKKRQTKVRRAQAKTAKGKK